MRPLTALTILTALLPAVTMAQGPTVTVPELVCLPNETNIDVTATVNPEVGGSTVRLYFRRLNPDGTFYYNHLFGTGGGSYWSVFPKPEDRDQQQLTDEWWQELKDRDWMEGHDREWLEDWLEEQEHEAAEYFVAVHDAAGTRLSQSPTELVQVLDTDDCSTELSLGEQGWAANLTIGETIGDQKGKEVYHWLCDGIVTRIDNFDVLRADEYCRACVIALVAAAGGSGLPPWVVPTAALIGGGALVSVILDDDDDPPASPSRP